MYHFTSLSIFDNIYNKCFENTLEAINTNSPNQNTTYNHMWSFMVGLCCGTPYILTASTLKAWFTSADVSIIVIGWLSIINIFYLLKFIWAPFFDFYNPFGYKSVKGWAVLSHGLMGMMLMVLSYCNPYTNTQSTICIAIIVSFFGSCITLALDGYWIRFIQGQKVSTFSGITEVGYRLGKIITGGCTLIIADHFDWHIVYMCSGITITLLGVVMFFAPEIEHKKDTTQLNYLHAMSNSFKHIFHHGTWVLIAFLVIVKVNEALEHHLLPVFMIRHLHLSLTTVGIITKFIGIISNLIGLGIAIKLIDLYKYKNSILVGLLVHAVATVLYLLLCYTPLPNIPFLTFITLIDNISRGIISTTLLAFYASQINSELSATQLSIFSFLTGLSGIFFAPIASYIVFYCGWQTLFLTSCVLTIPSIILLFLLNNELERKPDLKVHFQLRFPQVKRHY